MRWYQFIIILLLVWWAGNAEAQVSEQMPAPEQWQLTLDVIKSKAQVLEIKNNGLRVEYRQLIGQEQKLQQQIDDLQNTNEQMSGFLKERHGLTDQQLRIEELTQIINKKKQEDRTLDLQLEDLQGKQSDLDRKSRHLKETIADIESQRKAQEQKNQISQKRAQLSADEQLPQWRKQLEDEKKEEVVLENELGALKSGDKAQNLNEDALEEENKSLEARLDILRLQKLQHERISSDAQLEEANGRMYDDLKKRKDLLEADINAYELRLEDLRESSLVALSWPLKKKKLIHELVQTDARNNEMRDKIKMLREDIDVLNDQVAKLGSRVSFSQGQAIK